MGTDNAFERELAELAGKAATRDSAAGVEVGAAVHAFRAPIRVQVAGRAGVGRSTVAAALTVPGVVTGWVVEETAAVDVPGVPDPVLDGDVVVYVLVESVRGADRDAVRALDPAATFFVLNKADTLGESRSPADVRAAARARADECSRDGGLVALPLIATDAAVASLRETSGIDAVAGAVTDRVHRMQARRGEYLLRALRMQAARSISVRDLLENFLAGDRAVALAAAAARTHLEEWAAQAPGPPRTPDDALRAATWWTARLTPAATVRQRQAVLDIRRHHVRTWARMNG
ncbi:MAG: hypothetical protein WAW17_22535 [Rhodococcus sp. (in: high G+C Gram-positive bacteria)]|uniref:hypothetical protein n=1 Tax=Rhodococcus sp. TaxID=1831 RepID=UPI003BB0B36E